jgi:hypothetical protein
MMEKKDLPTIAEFREMSAALGVNDAALEDKWFTPEFWTMTAAAVGNILMVAVLFGWISATEVEGLTKAITAVITATEIVVVNAALVWKYISSRTALKSQMLTAKYQLVQSVTVERIRATEQK